MQAVVRGRYGSPDVLRLEQVARPDPGPDEALVRVHATSLNNADVDYLKGMSMVRMAAPFRPAHRILGSDVAGEVEAVGPAVDGLEPGDQVWADLSEHGFGSFAEFVVAPATAFAPKPDALSFELAAAVPSAATIALQGVRDYAEVGTDSRVLVNGAGGGMGSFGVQLALARGARVTAVDRGSKLQALRDLGAHEVVDFEAEDYTTRDERYDLILDVQARRPLRDNQGALTPDGAYVAVGGSTPRIMEIAAKGAVLSRGSEQRLSLLMASYNQRSDLDELGQLLTDGTIRPLIDAVYPLVELPDAMRRLAAGDVIGKVVVRIP